MTAEEFEATIIMLHWQRSDLFTSLWTHDYNKHIHIHVCLLERNESGKHVSIYDHTKLIDRMPIYSPKDFVKALSMIIEFSENEIPCS